MAMRKRHKQDTEVRSFGPDHSDGTESLDEAKLEEYSNPDGAHQTRRPGIDDIEEDNELTDPMGWAIPEWEE